MTRLANWKWSLGRKIIAKIVNTNYTTVCNTYVLANDLPYWKCLDLLSEWHDKICLLQFHSKVCNYIILGPSINPKERGSRTSGPATTRMCFEVDCYNLNDQWGALPQRKCNTHEKSGFIIKNQDANYKYFSKELYIEWMDAFQTFYIPSRHFCIHCMNTGFG